MLDERGKVALTRFYLVGAFILSVLIVWIERSILQWGTILITVILANLGLYWAYRRSVKSMEEPPEYVKFLEIANQRQVKFFGLYVVVIMVLAVVGTIFMASVFFPVSQNYRDLVSSSFKIFLPVIIVVGWIVNFYVKRVVRGKKE